MFPVPARRLVPAPLRAHPRNQSPALAPRGGNLPLPDRRGRLSPQRRQAVGNSHRPGRASGRVLCRWARDSIEPRQFETALLDLADELDSVPYLINYQRRRQALRSWSIDPSTWQQLLRQLDPTAVHTAQELGDQGRPAPTISVCARITKGDHPLAWRRNFGSSWILSQPGRLTPR